MIATRGQVYRALRQAAGRSQADVARELRVSQAMVSQIETDKRPVPGAIPDDDFERRLDWVRLERALALGRAARGEASPRYALGLLDVEGLRPLRPVTVFERRDIAHGIAVVLRELGVPATVVLPIWRSYLEEQGEHSTTPVDLASLSTYLASVNRENDLDL